MASETQSRHGCRNCMSSFVRSLYHGLRYLVHGFIWLVNKLAYGIARKLSLLSVALSLVGWLIFLIGFAVQVDDVDLSSRAAKLLFLPYWLAVFVGPAAFILATLYIALGSRFERTGRLFESITTLANFVYVTVLSSPFLISALFIFGAARFGQFNDAVERAIPLPPITELLGIDSDFVDILIGLIELLYDLLETGIQALVDLALDLPGGDFDSAVRAQFSGCVISLFFLATSMFFWPFFSEKKKAQGEANKDLR